MTDQQYTAPAAAPQAPPQAAQAPQAQMPDPSSYVPPAGQQVPPAVALAAARQQLADATAATAGQTDAGQTVEAMQADKREVLLPMETKINDLMAAFQAAQDTQAAQIKELQAALAAAKSSVGPPAVEQYANGIYTLVKAHADANPDLGREPFADVLAAADKLRSVATDAVTSRDTSDLTSLAGRVEKWATRFRGKHLDFSGLFADLELLGEAAERLAA